MQIINLAIDPCSKPRMTQSDRWNLRPPVVKYRQFADELRLLWGKQPVPNRLDLTFVIPMSLSWSKKRKLEMDGQPHQQKPDIDNLVKAYLDSLLDDDSFVWEIRARKVWGTEGKIIFRSIDE